MPHSTTGTTSYVLQKYSRAYPKRRGNTESQFESQNKADVVAEWQHFTNPTIRLVLEVKSTPNSSAESVRLRIIWQMGSELDSVNQQDFTFEDLDMLSFSDMVSSSSRKHALEGLPLKAVYRDTVVGIRYLHNRDLGEALAYRRFQISFLSAAEAAEFVDSIKPVCPCKINPTPVQGTQAITTNIQNPKNPRPKQLQAVKPPPPVSRPTLPVHAPLPFRPNPHLVTHISSPASFALTSPPVHNVSDNLDTTPLNSNSQTEEPLPYVPASSMMPPPSLSAQTVHETPSHGNHRLGPASSLPDSSFPRSSVDHQTQTHDTVPESTAHGTNAVRQDLVQAVLSEVPESTSIYDLSAPALERAIGEIIREEGFLQMVERVADMMTIRRVARV